MTFAADRERRVTAGNRLQRLLEKQEDPDDEFYGSAYGGFVDEEEDNDYHSEESEDDVVDSDFDQEDEEQQEGEDEQSTEAGNKRKSDENSDENELAARKRKKVIYQAQSLQQELKAQKKDEEQAAGGRPTRQQQKKVTTVATTPSTTEAKTLRKSTSVKRVELEKRQKERQERRAYIKGVASLRNTREVRRLTQEELLEEAKYTEEINMASLEAYQQIELKKKEIKRMRLIQECPRICISSLTISNEPKSNDADQWNDLIDESYNLNNAEANSSVPEQCSRTFVSFTHPQTFNEIFSSSIDPKSASLSRRRRCLCPITGMPAQFFDALTQMPYATLEAFEILRRIHGEEIKKQKRAASTSSSSFLLDARRDVNLNVLR